MTPARSSRLRIARDPVDGQLQLVVQGERISQGDDLSDRFGFDEARLRERMLRILVVLALRRQAGGSGWMTADELELLALAAMRPPSRRAATTGGSAVAKLLEEALRETVRGGLRLIEFQPAHVPALRGRGGRSRGPYRLGVPPEDLELDDEACWMFLAGQSATRAVEARSDLAGLLGGARAELHAGQFLQARAHASGALRAIFAGTADELRAASAGDRCFWLAQTFVLLANVDLEVGWTRAGILAVTQAHRYFARIKHPEGEVGALQVEAHLRGQTDDRAELRRSFVAARKALARLDDGRRALRKGFPRAMCVGTLGQRQSSLGDTRPAARHLQTAYRMCEEASSPGWMGIWAMRLGQNALIAGELGAAEGFIASAHEAAGALTPSGQASLARATAELQIATARWDEAERSIVRARVLGEMLAMDHQVRLADRLLARLEQRRDRTP